MTTGQVEEMHALLQAMTQEQLSEWMNLIALEMRRRRRMSALTVVK